MSKIYTGRDGRLLLDGVEQVKVSSWALTGALEVLETTVLGDSQRSYTPGVQEFNGSASLLYYKDDAGRNDAATALKKVLRTDGVTDGGTVLMRLRLVDGAINSDIEFRAYITNVNFGASVGEVSRADISFQATGPLTAAAI